jgi:hypothetical protein
MREDHIADHITTSLFPPRRLPPPFSLHSSVPLIDSYLSLEVVIGTVREYSVSAA